MDASEVMKLFDSCWFELEIFKKPQSWENSSSFEVKKDEKIQENTSKPEVLLVRIPTIYRSMSDQLSSKLTSFGSGSFSPDSVLVAPKLHTVLSGKEISEENQIPQEVKEKQCKKVGGRRRRKKGESRSLSELEFEELKGFMDLGFVFSEEDKDSSLVEIVPGLQRLGKKDIEEEVVDESAVSRPYLSEAWEVLDKRNKEKPLMNWTIPSLSNEIDMKDNLKWWAHTVASTVR